MRFEDALPLLVSSYRRGELVPFIGAGMSRMACTTWEQLVVQLEAESLESSSAEPTQGRASPIDLIRRADRAVQRLLTRGPDALQKACRLAVSDPVHGRTVPPQTAALAETLWPLVISTNYDDWYAARHCRRHGGSIRVLGRKPEDCQQVLGSLTTSTRPILWAVQGFLGGQAGPNVAVLAENLKVLQEELVVGHHHYQRVINSDQNFRRAFSEVFRRRSLLFLGSGLQEDYLVNLISEIILLVGTCSLPHFAMLTSEEAGRYGDFLQTRLNITPIVYQDHSELPGLLELLATECSSKAIGTRPAIRLEEHRVLSWDCNPPVRLVLRWGELARPRELECVAISVGRGGDTLYFGNMGRRFFKSHLPELNLSSSMKLPKVAGTKYIYQIDGQPVFAVAARDTDTNARDLRRVAPAVVELLRVASKQGFKTVYSGVLSAGPARKWHPTFSLIEMLRGARNAAMELGTLCPSFVISIVDMAVWLPLQAQKLGIEDILSGPYVKFWAESRPKSAQRLRLLCVRHEAEALSEVAKLFGFETGIGNWTVEAHPRPSDAEPPRPLTETWSMKLTEIGVVHGSTLLFHENP